MVDQTVKLKLEGDTDDLRSELDKSARSMDELASTSRDAGADIERVMTGITDSGSDVDQAIRSIDQRLNALTGADRDVFLRANTEQAEQSLRKIEGMLSDPTLTDAEIELTLDRRNQVSAQIDKMKGELGELDQAAEEVEFSLSSLGGAAASLGVASVLEGAVVSSGRLQAQLGLTADEARQFDDIAREVYADNFGDTMGDASQAVGQVHQSLGLTGDALRETTEGVFSVSDAFGHLGADTDIILEDVRNLTANFPGLQEAEALDMIAAGFQRGSGSAGDLQDTLQEYPGDFARLGLTADDMFGILDAGMEAGARNTDIMADAVREMGIRITTAGDTGQEALKRLFPPDEAQRLIRDFAAGGEAGRDAFFTIADALTSVADPQERYNLAIEIMGTRGEELANILPGMNEALLEVRDGTFEAEGATESLNSQYAGLRNTLEGLWRRGAVLIAPIAGIGGFAVEAATGVGTLALGLDGLGLDLRALARRAGGLRGIARGLGGIGAAAGGIFLAREGVGALVDAITEAPPAVDDLVLAFEGLETLGSVPESVAGVLDGFDDALDQLVDPSKMDRFDDWLNNITFAPFSSNIEMAQEQLQGVDDALATLVQSGNMDAAGASFDRLAERAADNGVSIDELRALLPEYEKELDRVEVAAAGAGEGSDEFAGGLDAVTSGAIDAAGETELLVEALESYLDAVRRATDPVFALFDAVEAVDEAHQAYTDTLDDNGNVTEDSADAAVDLMGALHDVERAALDGDLSFADFSGQLQRWVEKGMLTEEQAGLIRDRVAEANEVAEEFEGDREMRLHVESEEAQARLDAYIESLGEIPAEMETRVRIAVGQVPSTPPQDPLESYPPSGGGTGRSTGEPEGSRAPGQRAAMEEYHDGGIVPGRPGQEVPILALAGEMVIPTSDLVPAPRAEQTAWGASPARPPFEVTQNFYSQPSASESFEARDSLRQLATSSTY